MESVPSESSDRRSSNNYLPITGKDEVCLTELKGLAERMLPRGSDLRELILSEPDYLPKQEALAKIDIFVKLLYREAKDHN